MTRHHKVFDSFANFGARKKEAQQTVNSTGKSLAFGYDSFLGWTSVDPSDEFRVAELGDVVMLSPESDFQKCDKI